MSGYLLEILLAFSAAWGWLLWSWQRDQVVCDTPNARPSPLGDGPLVAAGLIAVTAITALATVTFNLLVLWLCFAAFLGVSVQLARRIPDPAPIISDPFNAPPPVLWMRSRAAALASFACLTMGIGILIVLSGRFQLSEISSALQPVLHPSHGIGGPSVKLLAVRVAVVAVLVGTGMASFTSPLHFAGLEALQQWPGAVAGWWVTMSRLLGLMLVWRIVQATYSGLESALVSVMLGLAVLSLMHGAASLWQELSWRGLVARLLVLHSGLNWLALAAAIVKPATTSEFAPPFNSDAEWLIATWAASSLALLVLLGTEQSLCATPQRLDYFEQLQGLQQHHPLATLCVLIGGLSLVIAPPLPQFWSSLTLLLSVLTPGAAIPEHARLMPHPAVVLGLVVGLLSLLAATIRTISLFSPLVFNESLGSQHLIRQRGPLLVAVIGSALLVLAGLFPNWWLIDGP